MLILVVVRSVRIVIILISILRARGGAVSVGGNGLAYDNDQSTSQTILLSVAVRSIGYLQRRVLASSNGFFLLRFHSTCKFCENQFGSPLRFEIYVFIQRCCGLCLTATVFLTRTHSIRQTRRDGNPQPE